MKVLITGALGYIGSITSYLLLKERKDIELILIDNLSNSSFEVLDRFLEFDHIRFYPYDITNSEHMDKIFSENQIDLVIHFAGLKSVKDSFQRREEYYRVNVFGTLTLLKYMKINGCKKIIFSSSACVYSPTETCIYQEEDKVELDKISNPYGKTKYICEELLRDFSNDDIQVVVLRYFNPVGTIEGFYQEPKHIENLMDVILFSVKNKQRFSVYGNDYPTKDGSCVRDFIHVKDLAQSHIQAMDWMINHQISTYEIFNIGTGRGISVFELIETFERVNNIKLDYEIKERRIGDLEINYSNPMKANNILNWNSKETLENICKSYFIGKLLVK
jgi:UDP-glucose 4-epimerase